MNISHIVSDNVITSLGWSTDDNFKNLANGNSGIKVGHYPYLSPVKFPASLIKKAEISAKATALDIDRDYTIFEQLLIISISESLSKTSIDIKSPKTCLILSTTKGNIDLLKNNPQGFNKDRLHLWKSAQLIGDFFRTSEIPLLISNACVSGVLALNTADRLIKLGRCDHVVVAGCDVLSEFIVSGFQSFLSLSEDICRPFDQDRTGLSLGEGAASIILSNRRITDSPFIEIVSGASSNDANHISGPSKTAEGLYISIKNTLEEVRDIDFISAHGTATLFNDDMESVAIDRTFLNHVPVNSFKGYIGHTLGAAGLIESIFCFESMRKNKLINTFGFKSHGTVKKINVIDETKTAEVNHVLKTASGFGGTNAAILFKKTDG